VSRGARAIIVGLFLVAAAAAAGLIFLLARRGWQCAALDTPVQRGRLIAEAMGCPGCHGPGGGQPIANPGAKGGEVPGWTGGTWMMWNRNEGDVRAWILKGRPEHREPDPGALIKMPAFEERLGPREIDDLVAYVLAASHFGVIPDEAAAAGHEAAYRRGCFGCHGPEGRGLVMNPGSFKGYIPPWDGPDYGDLVRDDAELRQWVLNGASDRFLANPVARRILETQAIAMPAYRETISEQELNDIVAYIAWVRRHPRSGNADAGAP
jgi:mono/diheme cytochrome c family protein